HSVRSVVSLLPSRGPRAGIGGELHEPVSLPDAAPAARGERFGGSGGRGRGPRNPAAQRQDTEGPGPGEDPGKAESDQRPLPVSLSIPGEGPSAHVSRDGSRGECRGDRPLSRLARLPAPPARVQCPPTA